MGDLKAYLRDELDIEIPIGTLKHWAYDEDLISKPQRQSMGRGLGRISWWSPDALAQAAGVWVLRGGRKTPRATTIKKVQQLAKDVYEHPIVRLEIPDDTDENEDPPLEQVELFFDDLPLPGDDDRSFLSRYLIATEKALHGWRVERPAIITFEWADRPKREQLKRLPFTNRLRWDVEFVQTTVAEAPDGEDRVRVLVDGKDVRRYLLVVRREDRTIRSTRPDICEKWKFNIPKRFELLFVAQSVYIEPIEPDATYEKITKKYKGKITESELRSRRALAQLQEDFTLHN